MLDDIKESPRNVWLRVLSFLEVPDDGRVSFPVKNVAKQRRSKILNAALKAYTDIRRTLNIPPLRTGILASIDKVNVRNDKGKNISNNMRQLLIECFEQDILLLSEIIERDLSMWLHK